jgi:dGTPase
MPSQRDRDRILNTAAFRRLAGVTQVVSSAEGEIFHNRLTHSLEVAQIGRRIAEHLIATQKNEAIALGGLDSETVEAACLAHDLGHPPFGHVAEDELQRLIRLQKEPESFEGNPQSFRIVTVLAVRSRELAGLNLTRSTLNALLKYPWLRRPRAASTKAMRTDADRSKKWGAYRSEDALRRWAREGEVDDRKCVEAELMDWADDIAYAVHDAEDFYRAGLVPLDKLLVSSRKPSRTTEGENELEKFVTAVFERWQREKRRVNYTAAEAFRLLVEIFSLNPIREPYSGSRNQRGQLSIWTSHLIGGYVRAIKLNPKGTAKGVRRVTIPRQAQIEIDLLKQLTWQYVILNPALAAQQYGQRRIVRDLFTIFLEAANATSSDSLRRVLPSAFDSTLRDLQAKGRLTKREKIRIAADAVAGLTEQQALDMHRRLTGYDTRSVLDPIVR